MSGLVNRIRNGIPKPHLHAAGTEEVKGQDMWLGNDDIRPLKLADRTWNAKAYLTFWFSAVATVSNWYAASSAQALGLSMWESVATALGGQILIAIVIVFNGRAGAKYHIGFPVLNRAAFGVFGAWWPTFNRAVMAIVWNGVNGVQGGQCIYVMIHALTPKIANLKNIMGEGSAINSGEFIGCIIFWLVTCTFLVIPVPKMKGLIYAKLIVFVISAVAMCAWTLTKAGGVGAIAHQKGTATGSERTWLLVRFFFLGAANCATFASNAADFQRYARRPNDVILGNLAGFPLSNFIVCIIGNLVASSSQVIYGEVIWNPLTFLDMLQTTEYSSANRAGCFFIAACFAYSAIFSSIFENSLPAGNDIAALFPKYLTVRKGFFICAVISFVINPWYLLGSAGIFISFLASYQIFLSAITGVLLCHYYIISRGYLKIDDLYTSDKNGVYHYFHGWNWRAYVAYVVGIIPNFYGFLNNMGVSAPTGVTKAYYFACEIGLILSFGVYWACCYFYPPQLVMPLSEWHEPKDYVRPEERAEVLEGMPAETWGDNIDGVSKVVQEDVKELM
ncbi:putative uridine permease [Aureobasidium pullulans]|uniref:Putative uridine permease n=1 Tax=Aureobasidium pullulans TaxID=5580 RepID=A0A4V4IGP2_AURPU|nr:putative uridine permease [Aureobasidium pullulans]THY57930.1 putative uridine permease [Aureobasidium pullulans]